MFGFGPSQAIKRQGPRGSYDLWLLVALVGLASIGVVMVTSSSIAVADSSPVGAFYYLKKDLLFLALGAVAAGMAMRTELKLLEKDAFHLMLFGVVPLLAVFAPRLGMRRNGAHRWLALVGASLLPVEALN